MTMNQGALKKIIVCGLRQALIFAFVYSGLVWHLFSKNYAYHSLLSENPLLLAGAPIITGLILGFIHCFIGCLASVSLKKFFPEIPSQLAESIGVLLACLLLSVSLTLNSTPPSYSGLISTAVFISLILFSPLVKSIQLKKLFPASLALTLVLFCILHCGHSQAGKNRGFSECVEGRREAAPQRRIVALGYDGASWRLLQPLLDAGQLPNLKRIMDEGAHGNLSSIRHRGQFKSPVIWTSIFTGQKPQDHGILDYTVLRMKPSLTGFYPVPYTSEMRRASALWNILSDAGITVVFSGLWSTWPAEPVDGAIVSDNFVYSGWHSPKSRMDAGQTVYPPAMHKPLIRHLKSGINLDAEISSITGVPIKILEDGNNVWDTLHPTYADNPGRLRLAYLLDKTYIESAIMLDDSMNPDFLFIYLEGMDMVQHYFWGAHRPQDFPPGDAPPGFSQDYGGVIEGFARYYDNLLGDFMKDGYGNTTFIILSDHGLEPIKKRGEFFRQRMIYADHSLQGIFAASGPDIKKGVVEGMSVLDVTPTILYYMGLPVSRDMDGNITYDLFTHDFNTKNQCRAVDSYPRREKTRAGQDDGRQAMMEKLRSLGYI